MQTEIDNSNSNRRAICLSIRAGLIIVSFILIVLNVIYGYALPNNNVDCIEDLALMSTHKLNEFFHFDKTSAKVLLIVSSLSVDFIMIILGVLWVTKGNSWRVFISLLALYILKFLIQFVFQERIPDGFLWEYPGFPSIMVSYLKTNDFFFCIPVGFLTIAILEFWKIESYYMLASAVLTLFLQIFSRISLRGNYIIDMISAIILAHYIFMLADDYAPFVDSWVKIDEEISQECSEEPIGEKGYKPLYKDDQDGGNTDGLTENNNQDKIIYTKLP